MACSKPCLTTCGFYEMGTRSCDCVSGVFVSCHCPRPWNYQGCEQRAAVQHARRLAPIGSTTPRAATNGRSASGSDPVSGTSPRGCVCTLTDPVNGKLGVDLRLHQQMVLTRMSFTPPADDVRRSLCLLPLLLTANCATFGAERSLSPAVRPIAPQKAVAYMPTEPIQRIAAPFAMAPLARPKIPAGVFDIRDFGATPDGKTKATEAFRQAIAKASAAGGGTVLVPPGRWLTGPIHLASNVPNLHVAEGARAALQPRFSPPGLFAGRADALGGPGAVRLFAADLRAQLRQHRHHRLRQARRTGRGLVAVEKDAARRGRQSCTSRSSRRATRKSAC